VSIKLFNDGYNSRKTENKRAMDTRMNGAPKISFDSTTTSAIVTENRKKMDNNSLALANYLLVFFEFSGLYSSAL
jgi:hypothetical protein